MSDVRNSTQTERSSAYGLWRYPSEFHLASELILREKPGLKERYGGISRPYLALAGHAIELALKAFLFGKGVSTEKLKKKFGHDLSKLLRASIKHELQDLVDFEENDQVFIDLLSRYHKTRTFSYFERGAILNVPDAQPLHEVTARLINGLEGYCLENTRATYRVNDAT